MLSPTNKESYIVKLLTLLVKRSNGTIRVPAQDLMSQDIGQGIRVWWDDATKELVIDHMPASATVFTVKENLTWLNNPLPTLTEPLRAMTKEEILARAWTGLGKGEGKETSPLVDPSEMTDRLMKPKVVTLTDETMAEAEREKIKQQALRELTAFQTPEPATTRSRPLRTFSKS